MFAGGGVLCLGLFSTMHFAFGFRSFKSKRDNHAWVRHLSNHGSHGPLMRFRGMHQNFINIIRFSHRLVVTNKGLQMFLAQVEVSHIRFLSRSPHLFATASFDHTCKAGFCFVGTLNFKSEAPLMVKLRWFQAVRLALQQKSSAWRFGI